MTKKRIISILVAGIILFTGITVFAEAAYDEHHSYDVESATEDYAKDHNGVYDPRERFWNGFQIIAEFNSVTLRNRPGQTNSLNLLRVRPEGIYIGLDDYYDEALKNEILSLEGIDSNYIVFVNPADEQSMPWILEENLRALEEDLNHSYVKFRAERDIIADFNLSFISSRRSQTVPISFVGSTNDGLIIGLFDYYDENIENIRNEILSLPGIPADIVITFTEPFLIGDDWVERWGGSSGPIANYNYDVNYISKFESINPLNWQSNVFWMGDAIEIGWNPGTVGSARDRWGDLFWSASHNQVRVGDRVRLSRINRQIGFVIENRFDPSRGRDASLIDSWGLGVIGDTNLNSFRANPPSVGTSVSARGAWSGLMRGEVFSQSRDIFSPEGHFMRDMLWVRNMQAVGGDSGAALIFGNEAIGILSFGGGFEGSPMMIFSKLTNIF